MFDHCVFGVVAEPFSRARLHQPQVHAGHHPGPGCRDGLQVRVCQDEGEKQQESENSILFALKMHCSFRNGRYIMVDPWKGIARDAIFVFVLSVISMSILYVLTLHHRGDVNEKDGYMLL